MTDIKAAIKKSLDLNTVVEVDLLHDDIEGELAGFEYDCEWIDDDRLDVWSEDGWHIIVTFIEEYL